MSDLDLLRRAAPDPVPPTPEAYALAHRALKNRIGAERRRPRRRTLVVSVAGLGLAAVAAVAVFLGVGRGGQPAATAATVLHRAAAVARAQVPLRPLAPGEYLYVKSVNEYLSAGIFEDGRSFSALVPAVREIWRGPDGGRILQTYGTPIFLTARDRETWVAAGRPSLAGAVDGTDDGKLDTTFGPGELPPPDLPTDPAALFARLRHDAEGYGNGLYTEMFTLVGDGLRETMATPEQRAALFEVAARIPGVELLGDLTDRAGRAGVAVAMSDEVTRIRSELIFDPRTSALLGEEEVVLEGNSFGYPAGTVIGYVTYLATAVVDSPRERPKP